MNTNEQKQINFIPPSIFCILKHSSTYNLIKNMDLSQINYQIYISQMNINRKELLLNTQLPLPFIFLDILTVRPHFVQQTDSVTVCADTDCQMNSHVTKADSSCKDVIRTAYRI